MKKHFLAIYFIAAALTSMSANARIIELNDAAKLSDAPKEIILPQPEGMPDPNNLDEVIKFFRTRFKNASVSTADQLGDLNKINSMDIQHGEEYIRQMQEEKKSTFEKIYDQAMGRLSNTPQEDVRSNETTFYEQSAETQPRTSTPQQTAPQIPVVNVTLPTGTNILAPAREHIPYMLASFNILPTGLIQVQEDITVVANGQKLKHGVTKIIPKFSTSRANVRKKLDIQLQSVTVNGKEIPYMLEEIGDKIYVKPRQEYDLKPGVYTYSFKYLLDRKLWYYDDFAEFYTDVAGSYWNLVITSANAIVSIPDGKNFLTQNLMVGAPGRLSHRRAVITSLDQNALGFSSTTPLLPGEGMHVLVSLDKNTFIEPGWSRQFAWFITDYGDVLFALAGLAAILISYMLSWNYIKKNKSRLQVRFKRTAPALRYLLNGVYDKTSFVSALLEFFRYQIIDIQKENGTIILIKKTDNLAPLSSSEKKAVNQLFPGEESVISFTDANALKFRRADSALHKGMLRLLKLLSLQLNIGYLLFSAGMLLLSEIAIAQLAVNPLQTAVVLISATATIAFYIWIAKRRFQSKPLNYTVKSIAVLFIVFAILLMSIYIRLVSALLIGAMVYIIFEYSELFNKRSGLMKAKIKEAEDLRRYLSENAANINLGREFAAQQANIFALDLSHDYPLNEQNHHVYKLNLAAELAERLQRK